MQKVTVAEVQRDTESTGSDSKGLRDQFMKIVGDFTRGELTFSSPFDLAASAALASNIDVGLLALRLFDVTTARDCGYEVIITATGPPNAEPLRREILNTSVASTDLLVNLLEQLMDELEARQEAAAARLKGPLTGG